MKIQIISPVAADSLSGNAVTARRWAGILSSLGHEVRVTGTFLPGGCDLLVCLHARRSHAALLAGKKECPDLRVVVAMTGTDLYGDLQNSPEAQQSIALADRIIVLQPLGVEALPEPVRHKVRTILQSVAFSEDVAPPARGSSKLNVMVLAHLREVKDPLLVAHAVRLLPDSSRVHAILLGEAIELAYEKRTRLESAVTPRFQWRGARTHEEAMIELAAAAALVITSRMEGGAHVISEAAALSVPILATEIPGNVGLLGPDHPGLFPVGDAEALAALLQRLESSADFAAELRQCSKTLAPRFEPELEKMAWQDLVGELRPR